MPNNALLSENCTLLKKKRLICKVDGSDFDSNEERYQFIAGYYENVYKKPDNYREPNSTSINDFLETVADNNAVLGAKLTEDEKKPRRGNIHIGT